ncbi:uncharacterized protein LOC131303412 [Rhododendron vialii]|uniref:uncharacterized protein LOC131303412 n=1 Tax=Rhododendron vialii TaxID=182163 RepID=UPI00265FC37F|nr:uncharacterized protein LOC131303412 [Rhododendron vialii]
MCPQKPINTTVEQEMAITEDLEMIMAEEMIIAEERGLVPCTSTGRTKDKNTGSGRGARGGKIAASEEEEKEQGVEEGEERLVVVEVVHKQVVEVAQWCLEGLVEVVTLLQIKDKW